MKMKILMVTTGMDIGGAETHIAELCRAFTKRGFSVTVASSGGVFVSELRKNGIFHVTLPLGQKTPSALAEAYKGLRELIRREKFDIVHAHARLPAFLCGRLHKRYGFRFVTTDHLDFRVTPLLKKLTHWGELTFAVSEDLRGYLIKNYNLNPEQIALTVNGIDTDRFSPREINTALRDRLEIGNRTIILHISRLERHLSLCVRALMGAAKLLDGRASLIVAGDGSYAQTLREEAEEINRSLGYRAVIFSGAVTDVENYIAAADIIVSPSRAAMEAMACAKPVIVCGSQGFGGLFTEELAKQAIQSNFCFRGASLPTPEMLARSIRAVLDMDEKEKRAIGDFARRFICENYSVDIMAQTQLDGYQRLLTRRTDYDILICGYYGYGNMGDETLLSVITRELRRLKPSIRLCALSGDPQKTKMLHRVDAVARFDPDQIAKAMDRSKLLLFGGGNLLQDKTSTHSLLYYTHILRMAKKRGLKIFIYANGIGPLHGEENRKRTIEALRLADSISLRDPHSFSFVRELRLQKPLRLTFDPAILTEKAEFPIPEGDYFAVVPKCSSPAFLQAVSDTVRLLAQKTGFTPILISLYDRQDMASVKRISAQTKAQIYFPKNAGECITLFSSAKLVISSRLHALIYATAAVCPMMGYSDDKKLFSYLDHIGFGAHDILPCGLSANESAKTAVNRAMLILNQSSYCKNRLAEHLPSWRSLAQSEIEKILHFTEYADERET